MNNVALSKVATQMNAIYFAQKETNVSNGLQTSSNVADVNKFSSFQNFLKSSLSASAQAKGIGQSSSFQTKIDEHAEKSILIDKKSIENVNNKKEYDNTTSKSNESVSKKNELNTTDDTVSRETSKVKTDDQVENKADKTESTDATQTKDKVEQEVIDKVKAVIKKIVGDELSDEELSKAMSALNLTIGDLFQTKDLKALISNLMEITQPVDQLTNAGFIDAFRELHQDLKELLKINDLTLKDVKDMFSNDLKDGTNAETLTSVNLLESPMQNNLSTTSTTSSTSTNASVTVVVDTSQIVQNTSDTASAQNNAKNSQQGNDTGTQQNNTFNNMLNQVVTQKVERVVIGNQEQIIYKDISAKDIMNQIVTKFKVESTDTKSSMTIQLTPENLGKLAFNITSEKGIMTGRFVAENQAVKEVLEANMINLKNTLEQQGVKVNEIEVVVGNSSQFFKQQDQQSDFNQGNNKKHAKHLKIDGISSFADLEDVSQDSEIVTSENSSIQFSA